MEITVIGTESKTIIQNALAENALNITITQLTAKQAERVYGSVVDQAVIVDGEEKIMGRIPTPQEVKALMQELKWRQEIGNRSRLGSMPRGGGCCCCG